MTLRDEVVQSIRRSIWSAVEAIQNAIPSAPGTQDCCVAQPCGPDDPSAWDKAQILRGYRDLHLLFGADTEFPEWAIQAEKVLRIAVETTGQRTRYNDTLAVAAGTMDTDVLPNFTSATAGEGKALLEEMYRLAPDGLMVEPGCVVMRKSVSRNDVPVDLNVSPATASLPLNIPDAVRPLLPAGMLSLDPLVALVGTGGPSAGAGITVSAPLYDLLLVKSGLLQPEGLGRWDVNYRQGRDTLPEARVDFLQALAQEQAASGAKGLDSGRPALISVPFEPLPIVGPPSAAVLESLLQRFKQHGTGAVVGGIKRAGEQVDPGGRVPYSMDGEFPLERIVTGIVLEPEVVDKSKEPVETDPITGAVLARAAGDIYSAEQIKLTMYWWMANTGGRITYIHTLQDGKEIRDECPVLACWQVGERGELWGEREVRPGTWLLTVWARADWVWEAIRTKKIRAFSIGYMGLYRLEAPPALAS